MNNIQQCNEENNYNAKEEIQRGWKKVDHATKELMESDPSKNLLIVETINCRVLTRRKDQRQ